MIFHSIAYAIFLSLVFILYWTVLKKSIKAQNILLLVASYIFYGWWDIRFLYLILFSSVVDYTAAIYIDKSETQSKRFRFLLLSLVVNIGFLSFFKYFNFFIDTTNFILNQTGSAKQFSFKEIMLPIGISFYTFQALSYTIDVYRKKMHATRDPLAYFVFVSFFPQIAAGPIERAYNLLPQFIKERKFDTEEAKRGLRLILWGVFKKVAIGDMLAMYVDIVYARPSGYTGVSSLLAAIFFTFQVYCDFSGYSDIAIGSARILGFKLSKNFNSPFFSRSMAEFWTRWHITLNTWFRDYIYIPLGGSKNGEFKRYRNVFLIFLISGLWHGASWKFIFWGAFHGLVMIAEIVYKEYFSKLRIFKALNNKESRFVHFLQMNYTFFVFGFALIFFRANTFNDAVISVQQIGTSLGAQLTSFTLFKQQILYLFLDYREFIVALCSLAIFISLEFIWRNDGIEKAFERYPKYMRWAICYGLILWMCFCGEIDDSISFVYFQF